MKKASKYIYSFLDNHIGIFYNRHGIEFIVNNDDSVFVNHWIKDPQLSTDTEFGLYYYNDNFNDFIHDFRFAHTRDLKTLSPERLWEMYYKGQAEIYCALVPETIYYCMYFRRQGNTMIVRDDDDNKYELSEILQTPRQFVEYTQNSFRFM